MASPFLENLKKAVENSEFNSDAAKKINDIEKLAKEKAKSKTVTELQEDIDKRLENVELATVTEEEANKANAEYEQVKVKIKQIEKDNKKIADKQNKIDEHLFLLVNIEEMVHEDILSLLNQTNDIEKEFKTELENNDPMISSLKDAVEIVKSKYSIFKIT